MFKNIVLAGVTGILLVSLIGFVPQINGISYADHDNCDGGVCPGRNGEPTNNYKAPKGFQCPGPKSENDQPALKVSGILDSRWAGSSPWPGCRDIKRIKVKTNACYILTFKGTFQYDSNGKDKRINDTFYRLSNKQKKTAVRFNGPLLSEVFGTPVYSSSDNHKYEFAWNSGTKTQIDMYITDGNPWDKYSKDHSLKPGNYIDNKGCLKYIVEEVACDCPEYIELLEKQQH